MLLGLSIENWLSFKEKTEFSMIATKEQQHGDRTLKLDRYKNRILQINAIYGANASGKSNFIKIISRIRRFVIYGSLPEELLPIQPFLLNNEYKDKPSKISMGLLVDNVMYEYNFIANQQQVIEEQLSELKSNSSNILFHRKSSKIKFGKEIPDQSFLDFVFKSTRENQLFLTNSVFHNYSRFKKVYDWFKNIETIAPNATFLPFERFFDKYSPLHSSIDSYLKNCDIGIDSIKCEDTLFDSLPLDEELRRRLTNIPEGITFRLQLGRERILIQKKQGNMLAKRMLAIHTDNLGEDVKFRLGNESDGSLRAIDLFPAFADLCTDTNKVYLVDEIDRSLHPLLVKHFIKMYLKKCDNKKRGQLIFTTHDTNLINQKIFRRDEISIINRDRFGASKFISLYDFSGIRKDRNIRKCYLEGRFGGIPNLESEFVID